MNSEIIKLNFKYRKLMEENDAIKKSNYILYSKYKVLETRFEDRVKKQVSIVEQKYEHRLKQKEKEIDALKEELKKLQYKLDNDSSISGIPTSKTPFGKKKFIPNSRNKSDKKKGGQIGHTKHKLKRFSDEEITEVIEITPSLCEKCHSANIEILDTSVDKDETDYDVKIIKRRYKFKNCHCKDCNTTFRANIPNNLKEENQYGTTVQSLAICLTNETYTPFNKTTKLITGITENEINMSEGYIAKLQSRGANLLEEFIKDTKEYITKANVYGWDDTVIIVGDKEKNLRVYCTDKVSLFIAHEKKDTNGIDEDGILINTPHTSIVMHDHVLHNYNDKYRFENVECLCHLERRLKKSSKETGEHKWQIKLLELLSKTNKDRNTEIENRKEKFSEKYLEELSIRYDEIIVEGLKENKNDFYDDEKTFIKDLIKYKKNYLLWAYNFSIPCTNNNSERNLRPVKSKLKISGHFQNLNYAKYYATIRSYIETCKRNDINIIYACERLMKGIPLSLNEILTYKKETNNQN